MFGSGLVAYFMSAHMVKSLLQKFARRSAANTQNSSSKRRESQDRLCWSCVAGRHKGAAEKAQNNVSKYKGCCCGCFQARFCHSCGAFSTDIGLQWCSICATRPVQGCVSCMGTAEGDKNVCKRCDKKAATRSAATCWSCVGGGMGAQSRRSQDGVKFRRCCRPCLYERTCMDCGQYNGNMNLEWCHQCKLGACGGCTAHAPHSALHSAPREQIVNTCMFLLAGLLAGWLANKPWLAGWLSVAGRLACWIARLLACLLLAGCLAGWLNFRLASLLALWIASFWPMENNPPCLK